MHIAIAGAGLIGRLLAWQLLRTGHQVTLVDRDAGDGEQSAGLVAAAMLAPCSELISAGSDIYVPGLAALVQWPQWLADLHKDSDIDVSFQQRGSIVLAHAADRKDLHWFYQRLQTHPDVAAEQVQWLNSASLQRLEPDLGSYDEAVYLPREGCLDNRALFKALQIAIERLGGQWHQGEQIEAVSAGCIRTGSDCFRADLALDCRGFGGKAQLNTLRGVRGEILWVQSAELRLSRPVRLIHPRYQLYIAPKPGAVYAIGATEIESESLAPVSVRSSLELLSALYAVHPAFAEAQVLQARSGCRPAFMDNLPRLSCAPGLMRVNGLYRHGYLLAPAMVNSVLAVLQGQPVSAPVTRVDEDEYPHDQSSQSADEVFQ